MPAEYTYDYAVMRVVRRVERGQMINVGVILLLDTMVRRRSASCR